MGDEAERSAYGRAAHSVRKRPLRSGRTRQTIDLSRLHSSVVEDVDQALDGRLDPATKIRTGMVQARNCRPTSIATRRGNLWSGVQHDTQDQDCHQDQTGDGDRVFDHLACSSGEGPTNETRID